MTDGAHPLGSAQRGDDVRAGGDAGQDARRVLRASMRLATVLVLLLLPASTRAQQPARYDASATPRSYRVLNPHHMYWVKGRDTIGTPISASSVERHVWERAGERLRVTIHSVEGAMRQPRTETFDVTPAGRVVAIDGDSTKRRGRYDLFPRLPEPARALHVGATWNDSIGFVGGGVAGTYAYVATRQYRVTARVDTLGGRMLRIESEGRLRYRDEFWIDSAAGTKAWIDVSGPLQSTYLFDPATGTLLLGATEMQLRGSGGVPDSSGMPTVPAGLDSRIEQRLISEPLADLLMRDMPAGDTTITVMGEAMLFLHTVRRAGDSVSSGFARVDGMMGTVHATYAHGRPTSHHALWTDTSLAVRRIEITAAGDSLIVRDTSSRSVRIPSARWAIADYAMGEHLVPLLESLEPDGQLTEIAIYRPYPARWDERLAFVRLIPEGRLAVIQGAGDAGPEVYIILASGELLFVEVSGRRVSQRVPRVGSPQRAVLEAILRRF